MQAEAGSVIADPNPAGLKIQRNPHFYDEVAA